MARRALRDVLLRGTDEAARDFLLMQGGASSESEQSEAEDLIVEPRVPCDPKPEPRLPPEIAKDAVCQGVELCPPGGGDGGARRL